MSGSITAGGFNGATGLLGTLSGISARLQTQVGTLSEQSATGLVSQTYGGLGALSSVPLNLGPQIAQASAWQQNITVANGKMTTTTNVMNQLESIATGFYADLAGADVQSATGVATLASEANSAISQVQSLLNTRVGGEYILAGQDSGNAPAPDASFNAFIQAVQAQAQGLSGSTGTAVAAATLSLATSQSPFSATIGTAPAQVQVDQGLSVPVGIVAGVNNSPQPPGVSSTGSYVKDLLRALATISTFSAGSLNLGQDFTDLVTNTQHSLQATSTAITQDISGQGAIQAELTGLQTSISAQSSALTSQVSSVDNVDAAATITALNQAQSQLEASYKLISMVSGMSLASYLPNG